MKMTAAQVEQHAAKQPLMLVTSDTSLDFFMDFEPPEATSQQKGQRIITPKDPTKKPFVHHFKKPRIAKAEGDIGRQLMPFRPAKPFEGPLRLVMEWNWSWRTSEPKRNRVAGWKWRDTQPDFDNLSKICTDQMAVLGFFLNDGQIADGRITKRWSDRPGIRVTIEQLQNP